MEQKPIVALVTGTSYVPEMLFHQKLSNQVNIVTARIPFRAISYEGLADLVSEIPRAVDLLMASRPSLIVVPIMTGSCLRGDTIANTLEQQTGLPVLTSAQEALKIFQRLGVHRVVLVSPFGVEINLMEKVFFSRAGVEVTQFLSTNENPAGDPYLIDSVDEEKILQNLHSMDLSETDAIFFDCPAYDVEPFTAQLAAQYTKPIFSNMQVMMFRVLERLGLATDGLVLHRFIKQKESQFGQDES